MEFDFRALDGSVVSFRSGSNMRLGPRTASGWAVVPSMMRAHPFTAYPAGHTIVIEEAVRRDFPDIEMEEQEEVSLNDGTLRVGTVTLPSEAGGRTMTVAGWEGEHGCMTTSVANGRPDSMIAAFDTLRFSDTELGIVIDSPVMTRPRPPELVSEMDGVGVLSVRPAIATELERIPRQEGQRTRGGEVFRLRADSRALLMIGQGSVVRVQPRPNVDEGALAEAVEELEIEWRPRGSGRRPR